MTQKEPNKIAFIINPLSGGKKKHLLHDKIIEKFEKPSYNAKICLTEYPGHASELAFRLMKEGYKIIVAVGGDGTINEVARELIDTNFILGIIPYGSGNGFARHFGIPMKVDNSIELIKKRNIRKIDVGLVNNRPFFCTSGLGFDAETGYHFSHFGKRGFLSYAFSFFRVLKSYKSAKYRIILNDITIEREAFFINVANISQFGYNFKIAPKASTEDGKLDLVIVKRFPKWKGIKLALQSFLGKIHMSPFVEHHEATDILIENQVNDHHLHIDGEPLKGSKLTNFTIKPQCLNVILPLEK